MQQEAEGHDGAAGESLVVKPRWSRSRRVARKSAVFLACFSAQVGALVLLNQQAVPEEHAPRLLFGLLNSILFIVPSLWMAGMLLNIAYCTWQRCLLIQLPFWILEFALIPLYPVLFGWYNSLAKLIMSALVAYKVLQLPVAGAVVYVVLAAALVLIAGYVYVAVSGQPLP